MKKLIAIVLLAFIGITGLQARVVRTINDGWKFTQEGVTTLVNVPHTWNAHDTWDETPGFYRGLCTYQKKVLISEDLAGKNVYVRFEGALQDCEFFVNGVSAGRHVGGYTAFIFDVTSLVKPGENDFLVKLSNRHDPAIPPLSADFTFYGGIYRDVELVILPQNHITNTYYASNGVFLTNPSGGTVQAKTRLTVADAGKYILRQEVFSPAGDLVAVSDKKLSFKKLPGADFVAEQTLEVKDPSLWDIETPNVYRVVTSLCDAKGNLIDRVENPFGFRTFSFDADKGFVLNGRNVKLIGTNRHQDYLDRGNALADEMHVRDVQLLKDMGGNFLRISHYPQDPIVAQLCDRLGMVNSIEIPIVNYVTESDAFRDNCVEMAREMVCQNYNNPSVIIWAYMNEILLRPIYKLKDEPNISNYYANVTAYAKAIDAAIKELDPYRPTMIPCHGDPKRYKKSGVADVADIVGWNYYNGWYGKVFSKFDTEALPLIRELFPDKPLILTEYGAGVDPRLHSRNPQRFDFSMEYGVRFHKYYLNVIRNTPYIAGSNVWNLNDFYAEPRIDAVPHVNNKGLVGLDRVPKDTYLYYQANLLKTPFLAIGGRSWVLRGGNEGEEQDIEVYSNQPEVALYHNSALVGKKAVVDGCASFKLVLADGENVLAAQAGTLRDAIRIKYAAVPKNMADFKELSVSLGTDCWFSDDIQGLCWIPDQEYRPGSWGYVGGDWFRLKAGSGPMPGSTADIFGTINNPIFQTQRVGISSFKADVPDGQYYVYLYFAELAVNAAGEPLPYNLGSDATKIVEKARCFDVSINGEPVLNHYNIKEEDGACRAAIRKFTVDVVGGKGLSVDFGKVEGEPVLNAIRIYRCF